MVFVTTYRRGVLDAGIPRSCQHATRTLRGDFGGPLREFNGQDDHLHLLAAYPPKAAVPAPVNNLKPVPARQIRSQLTGQVNRHITHRHFWSPSSFGAPDGAPLSTIRHHIEQQRHPAHATSGLTPPRRTGLALARQFRIYTDLFVPGPARRSRPGSRSSCR